MKFFLPKTLLFALSATVLLTSSCKKDKTDDPTPAPEQTNVASYKVGGTAVTPSTVSGSYSSNSLTIITATASPSQSLTIQIPSITGTGTFTTAAVTYSSAGASWMSSLGGSSSVVVTAFDATTKKASGTFTASLEAFPFTSATGTKAITEGKFTNVTF